MSGTCLSQGLDQNRANMSSKWGSMAEASAKSRVSIGNQVQVCLLRCSERCNELSFVMAVTSSIAYKEGRCSFYHFLFSDQAWSDTRARFEGETLRRVEATRHASPSKQQRHDTDAQQGQRFEMLCALCVRSCHDR